MIILLQAVMDNGPALKCDMARSLQRAGDQISDMAEVSLKK